MTNFKFEQPREAKTVYDEKGQMYAWYGEKIDSGYVVQPIYEVTSTYWCDGHEVPDYDVSYGDFTILREMYEEPPKQKYATETLKLQEEIKTLKAELKSLKEEHIKLIHAQSLSVEEVLQEKLSSSGLNINEINILIKALLGELSLFFVNSEGKIFSRNDGYVAVHLSDKSHPIHFFQKKYDRWEKLNCNKIVKDEPNLVSFTSLELAENYIIEKVNQGSTLGTNLKECYEISKIFKKHGFNPPDHWIVHLKRLIKESVETTWNNIASHYSNIKNIKNLISNHEETIKSLENLLSNSNNLFVLEDFNNLMNTDSSHMLSNTLL
jgi:hypothetical protein